VFVVLPEVTGISLASDPECMVFVQGIIEERGVTYKAPRIDSYLNLLDDAPQLKQELGFSGRSSSPSPRPMQWDLHNST
jgi:hypothetical protein